MRTARVNAQAKVNLRLRILAREASGFHQLETIFLRLTLADEVTVRVGGHGRSLDVTGAETGPMERNLAYRAAMAYRDAGGPDAFAIELKKNIPVGAGLGGGSADAAAVLRALNALAPRPLSDEQLLALAAPLGADVPFLTSNATMALAWGRGERMLELAPPEQRRVVLFVPPVPVSTTEAYEWFDEAAGPPPPEARVWHPEELRDWSALAAIAHNDFEPVISAHHPIIAELANDLRAMGASPVLMSGSGSAVYGVMPPGPDMIVARTDADVLFAQTAVSVEEVSVSA